LAAARALAGPTEQTMSKLTRRDFLHRAAWAAASAGLAAPVLGARQPTAAIGVPATPADVIVVGAGLAGLAGAITAADAGRRVLLIDKRYKPGGSAMGAGGSFSAANSRLQRLANIQDSPEQHFEDANRIGKGRADAELLRLYTRQAAPTQEWLEQLGVAFDRRGPRPAPEHELYRIARTCDAEGGGPGYIAALTRQLDQRIAAGTVVLRTETVARELVLDQGRVAGVRAVDDDGVETVLHGRTVLLACGGYGSNPSMIARHNPSMARTLKITSKYATGDGIRMAEAAGAQLVNMDLLVPYFAGVENPPGSGRTLMISLISGIVPRFKGDIWVSRLGTRFVNEDTPSPDVREMALRGVPDAAVFALFDEAVLKASKPPLYAFDAHLQEGRVVKRAESIEGLAAAIGVPPAALVETVATYNGYVDAGRDLAFGRTELVRFQQPPFYAIVASGVIFMTMGGVKTNARLQAIDTAGKVIAGLYAAGEVQGAGQWMGDGLVSGAGNGGALVFGRLAAQAAAAESRA
jgi:fumarate reductase flavoprotein subunit